MATKKFELSRFDIRPLDILRHLDTRIVRQQQAKELVATALSTHYMRLKARIADEVPDEDGDKGNVLLIGPTGSGKTSLVFQALRYIGVPYITGDATKITETGYVGEEATDLIRRLVTVTKGNIELAQQGVVYLDEIDKIARNSRETGRDVSGGSVQEELLKLLEGIKINLEEASRLTQKTYNGVIDTKDILFITSGAFDGLKDIIKRRLKKQAGIGFGHTQPKKEKLDVTLEDLAVYGMDRQLLGRLL